MMDYLNQFKDWLITLGEKHGVDPLLLGCLYFVSKVSMVTLLGVAVARIRKKRPAVVPVLFAGLSFSIPYLYIIIMGRNIAPWFYIFIGLLFAYGAYVIRKKIMVKPQPADNLPVD